MYECERGFLTRNPHPLDGCGRRLWSGLRRVVGDLDHGCSARVPPRGTWHLRWRMRLTCSDAITCCPRTADSSEKNSLRFSHQQSAPARRVRSAPLVRAAVSRWRLRSRLLGAGPATGYLTPPLVLRSRTA